MRIALFWLDFLHYHVARIRAAGRLAGGLGYEFFPIAVRPGAPEFPVPGYQHLFDGSLRVLADNPHMGNMQSPWLAQKMVASLQEINPDVVAIAGYDSRVALAALGWCRRNRRGAVLMTDSQQKDFHRAYWKEAVKRCLLAAFDSALAAGSLHVQYLNALGMPPERVFLKYDVVDNEFWAAWASRCRQQPQQWRQALGLPENFFLTACRLVPKKNVAGLLRAYDRYAAQEQSPWPLVVVGDGPLRAELEGLSEHLGLSRHVRFLGYLSADQMGPIYGLASVFILASSFAEQWGLVVNEAMSAGLPVLVSRVCGCVPDLVLEGVTGYTFEPSDEVALSSLMARCSRGGLDLSRLGEAAQSHIQAYSPQAFAENLFAASEAAVDHARRRRLQLWPLPFVLP